MAHYLQLSLLCSFAGSFIIGNVINYLQVWYQDKHVAFWIQDGHVKMSLAYWIISYSQVLIIPVWVAFCTVLTGSKFYYRELKKPIDVLLDASRKIADNQLDFQMEYHKQNELGMLCTAFDDMRSALYENNRETWRSLEERKRLNSAFSHDLRTPLTVLRGYADFLEKYIPDGKITQEKLLSVISMMNGQISRLEHYTQKMNSVQKLEDIVPDVRCISGRDLFANLHETGQIICGDKFRLYGTPDCGNLFVDVELVMQVYENLISNGLRYAKESVEVYCDVSEKFLALSVLDDGKGFSEAALKNATQPFFRDEKEPDKTHFGLGLYICRILCEKCGGTLTIQNHETGGKVTAMFFCG